MTTVPVEGGFKGLVHERMVGRAHLRTRDFDSCAEKLPRSASFGRSNYHPPPPEAGICLVVYATLCGRVPTRRQEAQQPSPRYLLERTVRLYHDANA